MTSFPYLLSETRPIWIDIPKIHFSGPTFPFFSEKPYLCPHQNKITMQNEKQAITQPETTTTQCLNCGTEFEGNFCPECGQSAETGRFTMRFIFENLLAAFLSKDGGIWFTLKNLFTRPGAMIVEILKGKRRRYFSPFPMLFFVLTFYLLLASLTGSRDNYRQAEQEYMNIEVSKDDKSAEQGTDAEQSKDYTERYNRVRKMGSNCIKFYNNHYAVVFMLTLPLFLFAARVCYGKSNRRRYYRAEYLVAITYSMVIVVIYLWLGSLMYLFSESLSDKMGVYMPFAFVTAFTVCLRKMMGFSIKKTVWRSLLTVLLYYVTLGFIALIGIIFAIIFFKKYM